jgi:hypothetical protein
MTKDDFLKLCETSPNGAQHKREFEAQEAARIAAIPDVPFEDRKPELVEADTQKICETELFRRKIAFIHLSPKAREKKGWPDLTFVLMGVPIACELKSSLGKLSKEQIEMLTMMKANGWHVYLIREAKHFISVLNDPHEVDCFHYKQWQPIRND